MSQPIPNRLEFITIYGLLCDNFKWKNIFQFNHVMPSNNQA
jgi:hypothetical protein